MQLIKNSDSTIAIPFLVILTSDHITGATGKSVTVTISKNGGAFGSPAGSVTEIGNGWYALNPAVADVSTTGSLVVHWTASACDPGDKECCVGAVSAEVWDEARSSHTTVGSFGGDAVAAPDNFALLDIDATLGGVVLQSGQAPTNFASLSVDGNGGVILQPAGSAAMTETYAALGQPGTIPQLLYELLALLRAKSISGTTLTIYRSDGVTVAAQYQLNDATAPTSISRIA